MSRRISRSGGVFAPLRRSPRGMTLLEVPIALAIFASMMVLVRGSMSTAFRFRKASIESFERYRLVQQSMDRMARELSMAFTTNIGEPPTNDRGEPTYRTLFEGDTNAVTFTTFAHVRHRADQPGTDQMAVTYRVERRRGLDGRYGQHLVRRYETPIDGTPERGGVVYVMLEDIENFALEYYDGGPNASGDGWSRSWDAMGDKDGRLPSRVRISITIAHPHLRNQSQTFVSQAQINLTEPVKLIPPRLLEEMQALENLPEDAQEVIRRTVEERQGIQRLEGVQTRPIGGRRR